MRVEHPNPRISRISTLWSVVMRAHGGSIESVRSARQELLERYGGAVQRYLRKVLHDRDAANEVFQNFALSLLHGDLRGAKPERGRFRNFVKGTLVHLVADYRKQQRRWPRPLPVELDTHMADPAVAETDEEFVDSWRDELLARAWAALAEIEARTGQPYFAVLRFRADHPELHSPEMAEQLACELDRPLTAAALRQILHRARVKFAELLLDEVTHGLESSTPEEVEQELIELNLLDYCRPLLQAQAARV